MRRRRHFAERGVRLFAAHQFNDGEKGLRRLSNHQIKANGEIGFAKGFTFTTDVIMENSAPIDFSYGAPGSNSQDTRLFVKPRFILNSMLSYKVNEHWSASLSGYNITENKNMPKGMSKGYLNRDQAYVFLGAKYKM